MAKKNLINLAKGGGKKKPVPEVKKPVVKKEVEKPQLTAEEERDLKAKQKVNELLKDVPLTLEKKEELLEIDEPTPTVEHGMEWLEEQVTLLNEQNELLKSELALAKGDYARIFEDYQNLRNGVAGSAGDGAIRIKVIELFNEIQTNHVKLGTDPNTGIGNFRIYCPGFLNRLITFFPFLAEYKRY